MILAAALICGLNTSEVVTRAELEQLKGTSTNSYLDRLKELRPDSIWLAELAELDPVAFEAETKRRELELAQLEKEQADEQLRLEAERAEKSRTRLLEYEKQREENLEAERLADSEAYPAAIEAILEGLKARPVAAVYTIDTIQAELARYDILARAIDEGADLDLTPEATSNRQELITKLSERQSLVLPKMRDSLGPIVRANNWETMFRRDTTMRTVGPRFSIAEFYGRYYYSNSNRLDDFEAARPDLARLRFVEAKFKVSETGDGTRWKLAPTTFDAKIGYWDSDLFS